MSTTRRDFLKTGLLGSAAVGAAFAQKTGSAQKLQLPNLAKSFKFAVVGDTGTGGSAQHRVGQRMAEMHRACRFEHVLMAGDNMYGGESSSSYRRKFEEPYRELLSRGVKFYAALGNHDDPSQRLYEAFNMKGERYYSFRPVSDVRFFALDSSYMDARQLSWLEKELAGSDSKWKIPYFHHPLYSSAERHGSELALRETLEPLFVKNGVDVVFTGHDHVYERIKPQRGVTYFVVGSSAKLREGDLGKSAITAAGFDDGYAFLLCEINGDVLHFQAVSDRGVTVDSGNIAAREAAGPAASGS